MKISKKLRILMAFYDLNNKEMAEILGVSPQSFSNYVNDVNTPPLEIITKLANHFKISLDFLANENFKFTIVYENKEKLLLQNNALKVAEPRPNYMTLNEQLKDLTPDQIETLEKIIKALKEQKP